MNFNYELLNMLNASVTKYIVNSKRVREHPSRGSLPPPKFIKVNH